MRALTFDFWNTLVFEERGHLRGLGPHPHVDYDIQPEPESDHVVWSWGQLPALLSLR